MIDDLMNLLNKTDLKKLDRYSRNTVFAGDYKHASPYWRKLLGVDRLSSAQKKDIESFLSEAQKKKAIRSNRKAYTDRLEERRQNSQSYLMRNAVQPLGEPFDPALGPSRGPSRGLTYYQSEVLRRQSKRLSRELFNPLCELYRRAHSRWVGGDHSLNISIGAPAASGGSTKVGAGNYNWSARNSYHNISVMLNWEKRVKSVPGLAFAGGMFTTHARQLEDDLWEASWVCQSRGFDLRVESGVILRSGDRFFHAESVEKARAALSRWQKAESDAKISGSIAAFVRTLSIEAITAQYGDVPVSIADSVNGGNCRSGSQNWASRYFPGQTSATICQILEADPSSSYVLAAVRAALIKHIKKNPAKMEVLTA